MTTPAPVRDRAFPIVIVGHVDHGKSTLVGRMLHETDSLPDGKLDELKAISERRGSAFEWSFVLDALQLERDQAITVDSTQIWFTSGQRGYVIIDAPGHTEFLKNMVTGAAQADAAVIVIDAGQGVSEQTRRHAYLLHLIGLTQVVVAVNKMDLVNYAQDAFERVAGEIRAYLKSLGLNPAHVIPVAAREGDNLAKTSDKLAWWKGPNLVASLDTLARRASVVNRPLRLPVQDVYRRDGKRTIVGRIESGRLKVGDLVTLWPSGRSVKVKSFQSWNVSTPVVAAAAGQSVALTLDDDPFVERGNVIGAPTAGPQLSQTLSVRLFWLGKKPLTEGQKLTMKLVTASYDVTVSSIDRVINVEDLSHCRSGDVPQNGVAEVTLQSASPVVHDMFHDGAALGRAMLIDGYDVVGGCIIETDARSTVVSHNLTAVPQSVTVEERAQAAGFKGAVLWFSGLSGAGKSTLAMALQRELFRRGIPVYTLDGDNIRGGLNNDLGFSEDDRTENLRRVAEVARLFADAGLIVISAFIAPTEASRSMARRIIGENFHEIFINADLGTCEARDVKGLYAKARGGVIADFTGISAPWEPPAHPDLVVETGRQNLDESLRTLFDYVHRKILAGSGRGVIRA